MNINQIINQNEFEVRSLLRRYRVLGDPSIETINRAHQQHGPEFMTKLLGIVTPQTSNFTGIGATVLPGSFINTYATQQQKPKFWSFWDNLLNRVDATGQTIGQFKTNAAGQPVQNVQYVQQQQQQKTVLIIAAVLIVAIVAILIFKKK